MIALSGGTSFYSPIASRFGLSFGGVSAPMVPQNLMATAGNGTVELSHDAFAGAIVYKFYRSLSDDFGSAVLVSDPPSADIGFTDMPAQGERYYYWVTADTVSGETGPSASAYARSYVTVSASSSVTLTVPAGSWTWGSMFFASTELPNDVTVINNTITAVYDSSANAWYDTATFDDVTSVAFSGEFSFFNTTASPITFWDIEP